MAYFFDEPSHTFDEYLLIPGYTSADCIPANVSLRTPIVRYNKKSGEKCPLQMNIPMVSAVMQSVSNDKLAIALAKEGGISFIYGSQTIADQAAMIAHVKMYKAGFVSSDTNIKPDQTLIELVEKVKITGHGKRRTQRQTPWNYYGARFSPQSLRTKCESQGIYDGIARPCNGAIRRNA